MPFSKSLVQPFRKNCLTIGAGWRGFFAPYNPALGSSQASTSAGPTLLDLMGSLPINTNSLPSGWFDLGWIKEFKVTPGSKIGNVRSGYRGAIRAQYRGEVGEQCEFKFREMTRMAFKIATGNSPFNLLTGTSGGVAGPLSASGQSATALSALGYLATGAGLTAPSPTLFVANSASGTYAVGDYIVCDIDYASQTGIVGDAGIPLQSGQVTDPDFIRKTSDYVARIIAITPNASASQTGIVLDQKMVGGGSGNPTASSTPAAASKIQKLDGWAVREGGTFISEWSALFICDTIDAAQIGVYYPHLAIAQFRNIEEWAPENQGTTDQMGYGLDCVMDALAYDDPLDGETIVGYKFFVPRPLQNISI